MQRRTERPSARLQAPDWAIAVVLAALQVLLFQLMRATSVHGDDPFDSALFGWSWLILPGVAAITSVLQPVGRRPYLWSGALIGPFLLEVALIGTVWHDADEGASFWMVGEIFIIVLGCLTFAAAKAGASLGLRKRGFNRT